ncbi:MAG: ABC transporter permease [Actinobacteria bacterium]|nr:ABC transporter permease [Actinomycetota bacterium]
MRAIRNIFRRKLRSALTIFGISIGVFALIVMGAMAEKINLLVDGGLKYYGDKVSVSDKMSGNLNIQPLSIKKIDEINEVDGVKAAFPNVFMMLDPDQTVALGTPKMIVAGDPEADKYESFKANTIEGRLIEKGDRGVAVVGSDLVKDLKAEVGKDIKVHNKKFKVVGLLEKTLTAPDSCVMLSLEDAQELFAKSLPPAIRQSVKPKDLVTSIVVYPEKGVDPEKLAKRINKEVKDVNASGPESFKKMTKQATMIFNFIMFGIGAISLLVGGLSVMNTMIMSISERTREIGIKKAIGASFARIMREFISEAALIGALGGLIGIGIGSLVIAAANSGTAQKGVVLFLLTPRLEIGALIFAMFLGVIAGLYPAWRAARMKPVEALRYE